MKSALDSISPRMGRLLAAHHMAYPPAIMTRLSWKPPIRLDRCRLMPRQRFAPCRNELHAFRSWTPGHPTKSSAMAKTGCLTDGDRQLGVDCDLARGARGGRIRGRDL